nr:unnamed protein product [Spirometra erinaceieuropaei]
MFHGTIYEQVKGTLMGSPISGFIAEAVLQRLESLVFQLHKPKFWARYVDDTFVIIERDQLLTFKERLKAVFPDIQCTMEEEENNQLAFLDVLGCRKDCGELKTKVFRKATNTMQAVKTSAITTSEACSHFLDTGLRRLFTWVFAFADIPPPAILRTDLFAVYDRLVCCRQSRPHDRHTSLTVRDIPFSDASRHLALLDPEHEHPFRWLPAECPGLTCPNSNVSILSHNVFHDKRTIHPPVFSRPHRLAPARLSVTKAEFEHTLQTDVICQSENPWASPLHIVHKVATDPVAVSDKVRAVLADTTLLANFAPDALISLMIGAPDVTVGAVL